MNELHLDTRAVHVPVPKAKSGTPLGVPIYQGHLFGFDNASAMAEAFERPRDATFYGRLGNPTTRALEAAVADLEGGAASLATGSGMGAISAVLLALLRPGDHVVAHNCLYGGTHTMLRDLSMRWNVEVSTVSGVDADELRAALTPATKVLYLETLTNPTAEVANLPALIEVARTAGVITVVDNTFATPVLCRPIEYGADVVVHSVSKYLSGHGDVVGGIAVFAGVELHAKVWSYASELGVTADPFAAWLTLRGLQTLPLRMVRHCESALDLASRLAGHPAVKMVRYPGLPGSAGHELARRLLPAYGGVLSFDLKGGRPAGAALAEGIRLVSLAPSLGDVKTLLLHPASTSHRKLSVEELQAAGIAPGTVRLAVGLEHPDDIWTDLTHALAQAHAV